MKKVYEVIEDEPNRVSCTLSGDDVEYRAINLVTRAFARLGQDAKRVRLPDELLRLSPEYKATAKVIENDEEGARQVAAARAKVKVDEATVKALRRYGDYLTTLGDEVQFLTAVTDAAADRDFAYLESILK